MTGPQVPTPSKDPLDFLYKNDPVPATQQTQDPLDFLYSGKNAPKKQIATANNQDFASWLSNVGTNWVREGAAKSIVNIVRFMDPLNGSILLQDNRPEIQQAGSDLLHTFDHIFDFGDPAHAAVAVAQGFAANGNKQSASDIIGGLGKGLVTQVTDLMELSSGLQLGEDDPRELTPEEKTQRIKNTMGLVAASAVAGPLARALPTGNLATRLLNNAAVGSIGGATYGAVTGAGDKDQVAQIINGLMIGSVFGVGHEALSTSLDVLKGKASSNARRPEDVSQARQIQVDNNTPAQVVKLADALSTSDDVAAALIQGKIGLRPGEIHIVPGVDVSKLNNVEGNIPDGYRSVLHVDDSGAGHLLVYDETIEQSIDEPFFQRTGLLRDQLVSYNGNGDFKVIGASDGKINIRNIQGKYNLAVDPSEVRPNPSVIMSRDVAVGRLYDDWKTQLENSVPDELKAQPLNDATKGKVDNGIPQSIWDRVPDLHNIDLQKSLNDWLSAQGFEGDDLTNLKRELNGKLIAEAHNIALTPDEARIVQNAKNPPQPLDVKNKFITFKRLNKVAKSNGFAISDGGSGRIIVRDLEGNILNSFDTPLDAAKWMNKTAQAQGPKLDDNSTFDGSGGLPPLPPEDDVANPNDNFYNYRDDKISKWETVARIFDNVSWITRNPDFLKRIDSLYGTELYNRIFVPISQAFNARNAKMLPWAQKLALIKKGLRLSPAEREMVFHYSQTMSPSEVMTSFMSRPMNPFEVEMGKSLANAGVDIEKIFKYRREMVKLDKEYPIEVRTQDPESEQAYQAEKVKYQQHYQMDPTHLDFVNQFDQIESMDKNDAALAPIVELARAINTEGFKGLTQSEFAAKYKMTPEQLRLGDQLTGLYKDLAKEFGINAARQLTRYMTHAQLFYDGDLSKSFRNFSGDIKTREFFAKLSRTGELSAIETDPIKAMERYIKGGFDTSTGFSQSIADAKTALNEELAKLPSDATAKRVSQIAQRYIDEMQGFPGMTDRASNAALQQIFDTLGIDKEANLKAWVGAATNWVALSGLGARPMLGIGHFGISSILSTAARSLDYTRKVIANGTRAINDPEIMQKLRERGVLAGLSPLATMMSADNFSSVRGALDKVQAGLFKTTLLPTVYDGYAAGHYITTEANVLNAMTRFQRGEITWGEAKKLTFLDRFDQPVVDKVTQLMADKKTNVSQVADYMGRQSIEELLGTYGVGNHPYGWDSIPGRTLGQFGNFAMFVRGAVQRIITRGSTVDRIAGFAKLAGMSYAIGKIGDEIGIPLNRMSPWHAALWNLSPLYHIADDIVTSMKATGYEQQAAKRRLLKLAPIDGNGNFQPSIIIPGSFAIDGFMKAMQDASEGNIGQATGEALGFRTRNVQPQSQF